MSLLVALALASAPGSPQEFLEAVYAYYRQENFSPFVEPERFFSEELVAAIREDERLAQDEVAFLDYDPLCQCQDAGGISAEIGRLDAERSPAARVQIRIRFGDGLDTRDISLRVIRTDAGWRIGDIATAEQPSLLRALEAENRRRGR